MILTVSCHRGCRTFSSCCNSSSYWLAFFISFFTFAVFSWMEWRALLRAFLSWNTNQRGMSVRSSERGKSFGRCDSCRKLLERDTSRGQKGQRRGRAGSQKEKRLLFFWCCLIYAESHKTSQEHPFITDQLPTTAQPIGAFLSSSMASKREQTLLQVTT